MEFNGSKEPRFGLSKRLLHFTIGSVKKRRTQKNEAPASPRQGLRAYATGIYLLALALRLLFIYQTHDLPDFRTPTPGLDISMHWEGAKHIRAGTPDPCYELMPPSAPFHPYFIAFCQTFLGEHMLAHRVFRAFLCSFSSMFIFLIAYRLSQRKRLSMVAGVFATTLHSWIYYDTMLIKAGVEIFLLCLTVWLATRIVRETRILKALAVGLLIGLLLSILRFSQGATLLYFAALTAYVLFRRDLASMRQRLVVIVPMILLVFGTSTAFKHRDALFGVPKTRFLPVSGVHVRIGFQHNAIGTYHVLKRFPALPLGHTYFARMAAEARAGHPMTAKEANATYLAEAREFIKENPLETLQILWRKAALFVNNFEPAGNHYLWDVEQRVPLFDLPHTGYGLLYILGMFGLYGLWKEGRKGAALLLAGLALAVLLVNLASFITARYRLHATVPFLILSAPGVAFLLNQWTLLRCPATPHRLRRGLILAAVAGLLCWTAYRTVLPNARKLMVVTAEKNRDLSQKSDALDKEIAYLETHRRDLELQLKLSSLYHGQGRYTDSFLALKEAAVRTPVHTGISRQYLVFLMWYGDYEGVIEYLRAARRYNPEAFQALIRSFDSSAKFWMGGDNNLRLIVQALMRDFVLPELRARR